MKFADLGLSSSLLETLDDLGYQTPSPIQAQAIPHVLQGKDVMAAAQTGTGKTAGFTLPVIQRLSETPKPSGNGNQVRALVLTPTRELAAQVADSVKTYGAGLGTRSVVVFGGVKINPQMQRLRGGTDVLIATPGRLIDLHTQNAVRFDNLEVLILDEADRMLDMGFIHDIRRIIKLLPKRRQTLLFSATFSKDIRELAKTIVHQPVEVSVSPPNSTVDTVKQSMIAVEKSDKTKVLTRLINDNDWYQVLVFSRTKHGANRLVRQLDGKGVNAAAIHGNKSQGARTKALAEFKSGKLRVLVATDIAARGIDIDQLPHVVNFDLPQVAEDYVHRIGRTGRAGASGEAVSLVSHDEFKLLVDIEKLIGKTVPRVELDGYAPLNQLPDSPTPSKNKPKKPRPNKKKTSRPRNHQAKDTDADKSGRGESRNQSATGDKDQALRPGGSPYGAGNKKRRRNRRRKPSPSRSD
ncbi:ATP-dependent RNA helicase RhlE [Arenicella chitinivorans]|uniref:DEAD-box ATP-dependent RNA helicase RhpA n=1 Tax=Arenicella chitinivorans TaxID=1329800 RepID=A0A918VGS8_9GAMM|nr:DEAD/DEAH box helicase [Arenicella chitinivorans]GHA00217.1 ATP-dependent RNA helicase RhlE [Arenicella chitinivorans]